MRYAESIHGIKRENDDYDDLPVDLGLPYFQKDRYVCLEILMFFDWFWTYATNCDITHYDFKIGVRLLHLRRKSKLMVSGK